MQHRIGWTTSQACQNLVGFKVGRSPLCIFYQESRDIRTFVRGDGDEMNGGLAGGIDYDDHRHIHVHDA